MKYAIAFNSLPWRGRLLYCVSTILIIVSIIGFLPKERIVNNELLYNPTACNYYISLQSLLANYPLLAQDKANFRFIRNRLIKFENDLTSTTVSPNITAEYKAQYDKLLSAFHINSFSSILDEPSIIAIATAGTHLIDSFYLDNRIFCVNPLYDWSHYTHRRILRHNLSGLYMGISNKYSLILSAVADDWLMGPTPGLFTVNQTTVLDTRYMSGLPLLTALYVLPKYDFVNISHPGSAAPWNFFRADSFGDSVTRKILNISGIDIFTAYKNDLGLKKIPGVLALHSTINPIFDYGLITFQNTQSYGLAYLAEHIHYENPELIKQDEAIIKDYFKKNSNPDKFISVQNSLYQNLMQLQNKHDIILESAEPKKVLSNTPFSSIAGTSKIKGIVGDRAFFTTTCLRHNCIFVFNTAYAEGWHAFVNNKSSTISRANYAFMATTVPQGKATVWFIYEPLSRIIGDFISITALIIFILLSNTRRKHHDLFEKTNGINKI